MVWHMKNQGKDRWLCMATSLTWHRLQKLAGQILLYSWLGWQRSCMTVRNLPYIWSIVHWFLKTQAKYLAFWIWHPQLPVYSQNRSWCPQCSTSHYRKLSTVKSSFWECVHSLRKKKAEVSWDWRSSQFGLWIFYDRHTCHSESLLRIPAVPSNSTGKRGIVNEEKQQILLQLQRKVHWAALSHNDVGLVQLYILYKSSHLWLFQQTVFKQAMAKYVVEIWSESNLCSSSALPLWFLWWNIIAFYFNLQDFSKATWKHREIVWRGFYAAIFPAWWNCFWSAAAFSNIIATEGWPNFDKHWECRL